MSAHCFNEALIFVVLSKPGKFPDSHSRSLYCSADQKGYTTVGEALLDDKAGVGHREASWLSRPMAMGNWRQRFGGDKERDKGCAASETDLTAASKQRRGEQRSLQMLKAVLRRPPFEAGMHKVKVRTVGGG